ncbi:protein yippee-like 4 isoform X1 [Corvus cornix cornix]|uniref:protein yippee-like 4 isoform X1 n=2 Tax=Corvus cornix cornix TaxID=932674 RepID=UPI00194DE612|nr:protein yippee-like 4 isoform X1 [Corvus cornix cornix]
MGGTQGTRGTRQNAGSWAATEGTGGRRDGAAAGTPGGRGGPGGAGGRSASPAAALTSEGPAVTSRRRWRAVTSRPRDESRCRDAAPGHAGPPRARPGDSGDSGSGGSGDSGRRRLPFPPPSAGGPRRSPPSPAGRDGGSGRAAALLPLRAAVRGCAVPPGALPPAMPPPALRRLPPRTFRSYLPRSHRTYSCVHCRAHLARHEELISKSFQGSHGRAYLFNSVVNVGCGPAEQRLLLTGLHSVADIFCQSCKTTLGWKYEQAFESSQKYKEGKFIIEMSHMVKENGWD